MPMVGGKKFPYTSKGRRDAKAYATTTGKTMQVGYRKGGSSLRVDSPTGKKCVFGLKK